MLVLTRKLGEEIVIDGSRVRLLAIGRSSVSIGIEAADAVEIHRGEIWDRVHPPEAVPLFELGEPGALATGVEAAKV
jgi:carbon storage regulator CsrA